MPGAPPPDLDAVPPGLWAHLDDRLRQLPVGRIRRMADYYALRSVETDHISRLARQYSLSDRQCELLEDHWQRCVHDALSDRIESMLDRRRQVHRRWMTKRRRRLPAQRSSSRASRVVRTVLFQARFNTIGPGGRTWLGNRYGSVRRHTFRLHWRP